MDERARFEEWASDGGLYPKAVERSGDGYLLAVTQCYWQVWKARAAMQPEANDSRRLDWLQANPGCNLISDDGERWAVSTTGFQPVPEDGGFTEDAVISSMVMPGEWRIGVRAAIDAAIEEPA